VYYGFGDRKQALYYYDIYSTATDSLYKKTQSDAAIYAEARWQAEKKQQQIKFLEQEKALKDDLLKAKESENDKQRNIIYLLIGGLIVLVSSATVITYYVRKQRKMEFQQQLNKISMLRLENARSRVSPHFLFNSLTTIQDELSDKPDASKRLHAIVNMLRCSLLNIEKPSIPLKDEMEFVNNYVLLQKSKFIHDLQTEINIENNDLFDYKIPAMIVQIPVENAIKHGLAGKQNGEKILKVDAKRENGTLMISIADNGIGREIARSNFKTGTGTGLKVISQTLHLLNSKNENKIKFSLTDLKNESGENCGTKVDISVPVAFNFEL
jgi:LytS/YehU family sensor histidine kinase